MRNRIFHCVVLLSLTGFSFGSGAAAQERYPAKPIRFVLGVGTGGVGDISNRLVAQHMSKSMGQPLVLDNRPSAGGVAAAMAVIKAAPDGYTLLQTGNGVAISASLFKSLPYDVLRDFAQVTTAALLRDGAGDDAEGGIRFAQRPDRICQGPSAQARYRHDQRRQHAIPFRGTFQVDGGNRCADRAFQIEYAVDHRVARRRVARRFRVAGAGALAHQEQYAEADRRRIGPQVCGIARRAHDCRERRPRVRGSLLDRNQRAGGHAATASWTALPRKSRRR